MKVAIVSSMAHEDELDGYDFYIGCDYGAMVCVRANKIMDIAVGDFDSVDEHQLAMIRTNAKKTIILAQDKAVSDTEYALSLTDANDDVVIIGGLGGRIDHEWANILCLLRYPNVKIVNHNNSISVINHTHTVVKTKKYLSLFPFYDCVVSLQGVKYPLDNYRLKAFDTLCLSNQIENASGILVVSHPCLLIQSQ